MSYDFAKQSMRMLTARSDEERRRIISEMSAYDAMMFDADFENWAHASQLEPPAEGWRTWLMMAGRGFGKTRAGPSGSIGWRPAAAASASPWSGRASTRPGG